MKYITSKPSMPSHEDFCKISEIIWESGHVTNFGPIYGQYLQGLKNYFACHNLTLANNATIALAGAIKLLALRGKKNVITSPFTFSATADAIIAANRSPVFADVGFDGFNITPSEVIKLIDKNTSAIMPVHCYGFPCDVEGFYKISKDTGIPIIYDAAHAFGVLQNGQHLLRNGDASVISTHATKSFNSVEGSIVYFSNYKNIQKFEEFINFGISDGQVNEPGLNGKLSELHAAVGLLNLDRVEEVYEQRRKICESYDRAFSKNSKLALYQPGQRVKLNHGYYPLVIKSQALNARQLVKKLAERDVYARAYFDPTLDEMPAFAKYMQGDPLKNLESLKNNVICLPTHEDYVDGVDQIISIVSEFIRL